MSLLRKIWHFIWKDDSILSWVVNIILAFLIVKFLLYPGLGLAFGTDLPVVAVVSCSMEHKYTNCDIKGRPIDMCGVLNNKKVFADLDEFWEVCGETYEKYEVTKDQFSNFKFKNGFNKGDIIFLKGKEFKDVQVGDIIVYDNSHFSYPIIHRVVEKKDTLITKGDNNEVQDPSKVSEENVRGVGIIRIPLLGWIRIWFVNIIQAFGG